MYATCEDQYISVRNCAHANWEIDFRRLLGPREYQEWSELQRLLRGVNITSEDDEICWGLAANKKFSTNSLYEFITNGGMNNKLALQIWKCKVPLKIRIFIWQAVQNKIQTGQQLKARN
jgi:hypothetical protein